MSQQYEITGVVTDGTLYTEPNIQSAFSKCFISVEFFSDAGLTTSVVPVSGTITFEATEQKDSPRYGTIPNGVVLASAVESYDRPNFQGIVQRVKATCSGIAGATHYKAIVSMTA